MNPEQFKQMVEYSKNNPTSGAAMEFQKRIKEGRYNSVLESFKVDPLKVGAKVTKPVEEKPKKLGDTKIARFFTGATQDFGKTIGQTLAAEENIGKYARVQDEHSGIAKNVQDRIREKKSRGEDTSRLEESLKRHLGSAPNLEDYVPPEILNKKTGDIIKEGVFTALEATSGGIFDDVAKFAIKDAPQIYKSIVSKDPKEMVRYIKDQFTKGVRPSVSGKKSGSQMDKAGDRSFEAVQTIAENKPNLRIVNDVGEETGKLPQTLHEFTQGIDQTKKMIYDRYTALRKAAGKKGAEVDLIPISDELLKIADDTILMDINPEVANYARTQAETFSRRGIYSAEEAERAIQHYNKTLEAFYKNPSYENASRAAIDALIVNNMRKGLDDMIEKAVGPGYQELKNKYGALKSIEKDVTHRAIVDARKNNKGLIDFTDVFTAGQALRGVITRNPTDFAVGGFQAAIKSLYKYMNDPNRAIKLMFDETEKFMAKSKVPRKEYSPESLIGKAFKGGKKVKDITKDPAKIIGGIREGILTDANQIKDMLKGINPRMDEVLAEDMIERALDLVKQGEDPTNIINDLLK